MSDHIIPIGWRTVRFGEVAIRRKEVWKTGDSEVPYVGLEHISPYVLRLNGVGVSSQISSNKTRFISGDTLFGKLRPYFRKCVRPDFDGICSTDIWAITARPESGITPNYLHWIVANKAFADHANSAETGTRMPRANWNWVENYKVLLPPHGEQQRIAELLSVLDTFLDCSTGILSTLNDQIRCLAQVALGRSKTVTEKKLSEVATFTNGYGYKSSELVNEAETGLINLKNFHRAGGFRWDAIKPLLGNPKSAHFVEPGEVLVAKTDLTQDAEVVGRVIRVPKPLGYRQFVASTDISIVRPRQGLDSSTLLALLSQEGFRQHCRAAANGTTVLHLPKVALTDYVIAVPDESQRAWLSEAVRAVGSFADDQQSVIDALVRLREFLLPRLLSGRLRVEEAAEMAEVSL